MFLSSLNDTYIEDYIFTQIHALATARPDEVPGIRANLNAAVDALVKKINDLKADAAQVTADLNTSVMRYSIASTVSSHKSNHRRFEGYCRADQATLQTSVTAVQNQLTSVGGDITTLQTQIKKDQSTLASDREEVKLSRLSVLNYYSTETFLARQGCVW